MSHQHFEVKADGMYLDNKLIGHPCTVDDVQRMAPQSGKLNMVRQKVLWISSFLLLQQFTTGNVSERTRVVEGIPPDARFVGVVDPLKSFLLMRDQCIGVILEHKSFPEVPCQEVHGHALSCLLETPWPEMPAQGTDCAPAPAAAPAALAASETATQLRAAVIASKLQAIICRAEERFTTLSRTVDGAWRKLAQPYSEEEGEALLAEGWIVADYLSPVTSTSHFALTDKGMDLLWPNRTRG
jgi:hypothetical protein